MPVRLFLLVLSNDESSLLECLHVGNSRSQLKLSQLCRAYNPSILDIAEPMVSFNSIPNLFWSSLPMKLVASIIRGGLDYLWVLYDNDLSLHVKQFLIR